MFGWQVKVPASIAPVRLTTAGNARCFKGFEDHQDSVVNDVVMSGSASILIF